MASRLREFRKARCWTQRELRARLGKTARHRGIRIHSPATLLGLISEWERGLRVVSVTYAQLFSTLFDATAEELGMAGEWSRNYPVITCADIENNIPRPHTIFSPKDPLVGGLTAAERIELEGVAPSLAGAGPGSSDTACDLHRDTLPDPSRTPAVPAVSGWSGHA